MESRIEKRAAGATKLSEADLKGKIIEFAWKLKKEGYAESTIKAYVGAVKLLIKEGADVFDPESVKDVIARQNWTETSKFNYANFYDAFAKIMGISWRKPRYKPDEKLPFIPQEKHIDQLIYSAGKKMGTVLQLTKETAMRIGEVRQLRWENIDSENNRIILNNPEKRGTPRIFKVSSELMARIMGLPRKSERVFRATTRDSYEAGFLRLRKHLARKLNNPALMKITFHTIRHWKATMLYYQTKDILYVMKFLGHKNIKNTLIYTQLIEFGAEEEYHIKVARTLKEACELAEAGFQYFTQIEGAQIFRKRR
ncbi:MAG: site-specific integrase [Candidatus Bathyarchaeota archaeon]|nr:site-specific integrase [Candidatus Bathyarchaeota archaeon]